MQYENNVVFYFERGSFFSGSLMYQIDLIDNKYILKSYAYNDFCWMGGTEYEVPEKEIHKLQSLLKPVSKWKRTYECKLEILDGYGWSIYFNHKDTLIDSNGYEKYPLNYRPIINKLQLFVERLGVKYDDDYLREGRKERMEL